MATILVVEDNPATRELLREFLQGDGHTVLEASTGLEAITVAGVASPDLILLDLRLPDAHGFDLARRLRQQPRTATIPILVLTAYPETPGQRPSRTPAARGISRSPSAWNSSGRRSSTTWRGVRGNRRQAVARRRRGPLPGRRGAAGEPRASPR